jgi:glycosyltransferase involved in cell wall biosynthesis
VYEFDAVWVANLIPYKQAELFIELAQRNSTKKFLLIGASADTRYNQKIKDLASTVENLKAIGFMPPDEILHWMWKCRLTVNTTRVATNYEEGFSNVQLMGWMCGLPSLSLISDPDNVIVSNQMGYRSGTFNQLCDDFKKLTSDADLYSRMSKNAISYVIRHHNRELLLQKYLQVLNHN